MALSTPLYTETNLVGYLYSGITASASSIQVVFRDKITNAQRTPQSSTRLFVVDKGTDTFPNPNYEIILATAHTTTSGITTLTGVTRGLVFYGTSVAAGTGLSHLANATVGCVDVHLLWTILASILDGTNSGPGFKLGVRNTYELAGVLNMRSFADATARDTAIPSPQVGDVVYLVDSGELWAYLAGSWVAQASGGTFPDMSTSVAGKAQAPTSGQVTVGTATGSTGAPLAVTPDALLASVYGVQLPQSGDIKMTAAAAAPAGWLLCDGTSYLQSDYVALFAAISTTYGSADGTHFNVPDLRGRSPVGAGTGTGGGAAGTGLPTGGTALTARALGAWLGEQTHTLSEAEMPAHTHTYLQATGGSGPLPAGSGANSASTATSGSTGSGTAHNVMQPVMTVNFCIKT